MNKPVAYWIASAVLVILVLTKFSPQSGFTSLIRFGETWEERRHLSLRGLPVATVPASSGYDGQFYAQISLDPLLRSESLAPALDSPTYRARRILVPATASLLGLGQPWWVLQAYALLNVLCWLALGWLLYRQISPDDRFGFARWLGCMFSMGALDSVRQSLVDLPALLLLVLATTTHTRNQPARTTLWSALSVLAKETSLLGAIAVQCDQPLRTLPWRRIGLSLVACALPFALWSLYVEQRFSGAPKEVSLGNFSWPFLGLLTQAKYALREISFGNVDGRYSFGLAAMAGLLTQAWVLWRTPLPASAWWRVGAAYSVLLIFLSSWVWSGYWAACRALLPMTVAFNLILPGKRTFLPLWILGNLTLVHAVWRFL